MYAPINASPVELPAIGSSTTRPITLRHISALNHKVLMTRWNEHLSANENGNHCRWPENCSPFLTVSSYNSMRIRPLLNPSLTHGNVEEGPLQALLVVYGC